MLRVEAGHHCFFESESEHADFTYLDSAGHMGTALEEAGVHLSADWSRRTTYHLEVTTTAEACKVPFAVSQRQLDKVRYIKGE